MCTPVPPPPHLISRVLIPIPTRHPCPVFLSPFLGRSSDLTWTDPFSGGAGRRVHSDPLGHTEACCGWGQDGGLLAVLASTHSQMSHPRVSAPGWVPMGDLLGAP